MDVDMSISIGGDTPSTNRRTKCNRKWGILEDNKLVESLIELVTEGGWRADNGTFKSGYLQQLERLMEQKLPRYGLKSTPHIESRIKLLKRHYNAIVDMLGPNCSGFGWDDYNKCITCEEDIFREWVKVYWHFIVTFFLSMYTFVNVVLHCTYLMQSHPNAQGMRNKPFPHFNDLAIVFGRDWATGARAETPADIVEEVEMEEQQDLHTSPAIDLESQEEESFFQSQSFTMHTSQTPNNEAPGPSRPTRSKKPKNETLEVVRELKEMSSKVGNMMEAAGAHIGSLASCFRHESDVVQRRMQ